MNEMTTEARLGLETFFHEAGGGKENWPQIALATERFRAIDLSCRACDACGAGAGCWAWVPGGGLRSAPVFTPNLQYTKSDERLTLQGGDAILHLASLRTRLPKA